MCRKVEQGLRIWHKKRNFDRKGLRFWSKRVTDEVTEHEYHFYEQTSCKVFITKKNDEITKFKWTREPKYWINSLIARIWDLTCCNRCKTYCASKWFCFVFELFLFLRVFEYIVPVFCVFLTFSVSLFQWNMWLECGIIVYYDTKGSCLFFWWRSLISKSLQMLFKETCERARLLAKIRCAYINNVIF